MRKAFYILISLLLASFIACNDDFEDYSTSPNDLLSFAVDTLRFDTILTTVNTPYAVLKVYNKNDKALLISSIQLKDGENSGFKINVDGMAGDSFNDVEVRSKDSLFLFIDIKPNNIGLNEPTLITDRVEFITNAVKQEVVLEAYGQDVTFWNGIVIDADSILNNEKPYLIYDSLIIKEGVTVEISPGTVFYMHGNAEIIVEGTLLIKGTADNPVVIRGDRMDKMIGIPYDRIPGQWRGIRYREGSYNNIIEHAYIRNGTSGLIFEPSEPELSKIVIKNSKIYNFKGHLIYAVNSNIIAENCEFANSKDALVYLIGGKSSFTHCTLANYYGVGIRREAGYGDSNHETLVFSNTYQPDDIELDPIYYDVLQADFKNNIVWGARSEAHSWVKASSHEGSLMNLYFLNCLIPNDSQDDEETVNCIYALDPLFKKKDVGDSEDMETYFVYDFGITEDSFARNLADVSTAQTMPYDLNGVDRFMDEGPDIGAYEFVKTEEETEE